MHAGKPPSGGGDPIALTWDKGREAALRVAVGRLVAAGSLHPSALHWMDVGLLAVTRTELAAILGEDIGTLFLMRTDHGYHVTDIEGRHREQVAAIIRQSPGGTLH